ncbi:ribonucleases P/MRP protein subunit POP1 isoform X2 [Pseudomyrmex gracilis]|uniref:ribonucleases P/MRP protein subunit POP1 isoform X2 n=1 Tax=Pseudomyrmex gracilis TaxID=219809 RepID=UPI0009949352|nr:ribonucleases P/MRP protein subunit POP1 isoform X2 [Pseudomyrmex gracilis]
MEKKQFDAFLGGSESLPHDVPIMQFVSARAREISAMTSSLENPKQTKLIFQKLPVYMRRRVMSHNVKRLPRRLREAHLAQMAKSAKGKNIISVNKRPSRKYRRRPHMLLSEYGRRQRNKVWLETHIWHAKRFHLIDKWGYRIASYSNDKCFRANYRAVEKHCLLQDISYYTCIEIKGEESLLKTTLKTHCDPSALTFAAKKYTTGHKEGTLMFFKKNGYPHSPIGNVDFFWRPKKSDIRTIWIWIHPAFYDDVFNEIISSFNFIEDNNIYINDTTRITPNLHNTYVNDAGCKMNILRNALNRFRLHGPLTLNVLTQALRLPSLIESDFLSEMDTTGQQEQTQSLLNDKTPDTCKLLRKNVLESTEKMEIDKKNEENTVISKYSSIQEVKEKTWHIKYYKNKTNMEAFKAQKQLWQIMESSESPNCLPSNIIIGLTVLDPRFYLPIKRTKCTEFSQLTLLTQSPNNSNCSPIWDVEIRRVVSNSCVSTSTINNFRSECIVPGVSNDKYLSEDIMAKIPILLIQKPGNITDVIIPSGWAMPFWLALILRCARVGALRESRSIAFETLKRNTPDVNDPDSPAYMREASNTKEELTKKYFCYPPNRRVNYTKFGISSPFSCDWKILTREWSGAENFYVLRNRELLLHLRASICPYTKNKNSQLVQKIQFDFQDIEKYKNCLICVYVSMIGRGLPKKFAIICVPTAEDLKTFENDKKWTGPVEKHHVDPNEKSRKILRKNHLTLLKRLRRQRVRQKRALGNNLLKAIENDLLKSLKESGGGGKLDKCDHFNSLSQHRKIISDYLEKMSKLFLPECKEVRYSCDREIMGYLTEGHFSFSRAKGIGIGYVTLPSLFAISNKKSNIVLVRNTQTRQYRLAKLDILDF